MEDTPNIEARNGFISWAEGQESKKVETQRSAEVDRCRRAAWKITLRVRLDAEYVYAVRRMDAGDEFSELRDAEQDEQAIDILISTTASELGNGGSSGTT